MQAITKLESLPNELLLRCFGYLHAVDMFHSFDYLNSRFSTLIRNISLHLDVGKVEKTKLTQFCIKMLLSPSMKDQIKSLIMKEKDAFENLRTLLSFVSLDELTQLRALTFNDKYMSSWIDQIAPMLSLLPNLCYFCVENVSDWRHLILCSAPNSTVTTLAIQTIPDRTSLNHSSMSLTHLTISSCNFNDLCQFFIDSPMLQYLKIKSLSSTYDSSSKLPHGQANHLERLVVESYRAAFDNIDVLLQQTPNLRSFMLHSSGDMDIVDGNRWRKLITNALPLLDVFKFVFNCSIDDDDYSTAVDKFRPFQNGYWTDQHHWYTEYVISDKEVFVYTVPYMLDDYEIRSNAKRYCSKPINSVDAFVKVTDLKVNIASINDLDHYYFPNVKRLTLNNELTVTDHDYPYLKLKHISYLKNIVNLGNVRDLEILSTCRWRSTSVILQLLKEAVQLSSLKTDKTILRQLLKNRELCECLMIKKLDITDFGANMLVNREDMMKICETFRKMEEFRCKIDEFDAQQRTIDHLSKQLPMKKCSSKTSCSFCGDLRLKPHRSELDLYSFAIHYEYTGFYLDDDENILDYDDNDNYSEYNDDDRYSGFYDDDDDYYYYMNYGDGYYY